MISSAVKRPSRRSAKLSSSLPEALSIIAPIFTPRGFFPAQQSSSRTITSCDTSTSRRVRYPESAVFNAVSASPFLPPCEDIKYSRTVKPSLKQDLTGISINSPCGFTIKPRIPANCLIWSMEPRAPEFAIIQIGLKSSASFLKRSTMASTAPFQTRTISLCFCSSVNKPRAYCVSIFVISFSASAINSFFSVGICMSNTEVVIAPIVEYLNPKVLILSSTPAAFAAPPVLKHALTILEIYFLSTGMDLILPVFSSYPLISYCK